VVSCGIEKIKFHIYSFLKSWLFPIRCEEKMKNIKVQFSWLSCRYANGSFQAGVGWNCIWRTVCFTFNIRFDFIHEGLGLYSLHTEISTEDCFIR
jgi:hypothetical protein